MLYVKTSWQTIQCTYVKQHEEQKDDERKDENNASKPLGHEQRTKVNFVCLKVVFVGSYIHVRPRLHAVVTSRRQRRRRGPDGNADVWTRFIGR